MTQFRHPPRQAVDGIVLLNKPAGVSSNGVLQKVRALFNAKKAGHTGALDPFATGLLPICLGEATKVSGLLLDSDKGYIATLKLGEATTTGDTEGEVICQSPLKGLSAEQVKNVLQGFLGKIEQTPPMYSALKHQGKPLYWYARQGIEIDRPVRKVNIYALELISFDAYENTAQLVFQVQCSKGTYVRTLGEDIAKALGTVGHLTALHRIKSGALTAEQMVSLEQIETAIEDGKKADVLWPVDLPLKHLERIDLVLEQAKWVQNGGQLRLPKPTTDWVRLYDPEGVCLGIGEWLPEQQRIKPKRLFHLAQKA